MPIPALKIKSPQNWKKNRRYPSDKLIARRRASAFKPRKTKKLRVPRKSSYFGKRGDGKNKFYKQVIKPLIKPVLIIVIILAIFIGGTFLYYSTQVPTREEFIAASEGSSTKIYDRTGEHVLYNLSGEQKKSWIPLDQIPQHVKWAVIAIEDDQFYAHRGFDFPALIKAGLHEVFGIGPQRGGSTITQQLVKNVLLTPEKTYRRKIKELIISYYLEKKFSKDEILELYFNVIPYGSTAYGIEAAAETYFAKKTQELTVSQGALLAAMLKKTTYYSPYGSHLDELIERQHFVLTRMAKLGYVTEEEVKQAKDQELEFRKLSQSITAPHFVLYVKEMLAEKYGEEIVEKGGLKIITTLDFDKQNIAEEAVVTGVERNETRYAAHNAALVSIDAKTGEVLAMVGSRDYFNEEYDGAVNVTMRPRQPGSSFKPVVYAAAFEQGLSPQTILFDTLTKFKTEIEGEYEPHNYEDEEFGPVPIKQALAGSLNIPAVKTIYLTGIENVLDLAEKMGYTTFGDRSRFGLSLVLGGGEVMLIDHVKGFSVLANKGQLHNLQYILKVEDQDGKTLEEFKPENVDNQEVMDEQIVKQINDILSDNAARAFVFGESNYLNLGERPVAAKTGTTDDYRDGWTIGYTPSVVTGVWVGNNDNTAMKGAAAGGNVAAPIWHKYMSKALEGQPIEYFEKPEPQELPQKPMLNGKIAQENIVKIDKASGKLATDLTPPSQIEEKAFRELHSILHYVNKNNIQGPIPSEPDKDRQYASWEEAVVKWAEENDYEVKEEAPTEYDDLHTEENKPDLEIVSPSHNQRLHEPDFNVDIRVTTKRSLDRVEYYINNQLISTQVYYPYDLSNYQLLGFENGEKWLRVIAYDNIDNFREQSIKIHLNLSSQYTQPAVWLAPQNNDEIYQAQFPYNLRIRINNPSLYKKADFYLKRHNQSSTWIGYKEPPELENNILLEEAQAGNYSFYIILTDKNDNTTQTQEIKARVLD